MQASIHNQSLMDRDSISGEMTETTVILPLTTIEEYIDEIDNNDNEHKNINEKYYQRMNKYSLQQYGKRNKH
jgi:hypothetical protein